MSEKLALPAAALSLAPAFTDELSQEWYIRVRFEFQGKSLSKNKTEAITEIQEKILRLHEGLKHLLSGHDIHPFPQRLLDSADTQKDNHYTCYWLIGLPTIPSTQLSPCRKLLKEWQDSTSKAISQGNKTSIQAKFVPRKTILDQSFKEDLSPRSAPSSSSSNPMKDSRQSGETFKKIPGSNPAQIRKQFLQHAMGGDLSSKPEGKLRPPKEVFRRLRFDTSFDEDEYVVGYIDRQAGILEKPVKEWKEYDEDELIAYFKHVPEKVIVWDRAGKVDVVFGE